MNASAWLASRESRELLEWLESQGKLCQRRARLFCVAASRRHWHLLPDEPCRRAVAVAERFADGEASQQELAAAQEAAHAYAVQFPWVYDDGTRDAAEAVEWTAWRDASDAVVLVADVAARVGGVYCPAGRANRTGWNAAGYEAEKAALSDVVRCIFGNPLEPLRPLTPPLLICQLAQAAYDNRVLPEGALDETHLAVLCDALEDVGLADPALLEHLRGGRHWPGCHAIDRLLGRP